MTDAPNFVKRPSPSSASGHIPAHTNEFANPKSTTNQMDMSLVWPKNVTWPLCINYEECEDNSKHGAQTKGIDLTNKFWYTYNSQYVAADRCKQCVGWKHFCFQ